MLETNPSRSTQEISLMTAHVILRRLGTVRDAGSIFFVGSSFWVDTRISTTRTFSDFNEASH